MRTGGALLLGVVGACSSSTSFDPGVPTHEFTPVSGWIALTGSCSGDEYIVVNTTECSGCADININSPAYALCDGNAYTVCSCESPPGWTEVDFVAIGDDGCCSDGGDDASGDAADEASIVALLR